MTASEYFLGYLGRLLVLLIQVGTDLELMNFKIKIPIF